MIDRLPRSAGWFLVALGILTFFGGAYAALATSPPLAVRFIILGALLYIATVRYLLSAQRINRAFIISTRLLFPAVAFVLFLQAAAQATSTGRILYGGLLAVCLGIYSIQLGLLKTHDLSTSYDNAA
jgi:hypothetical protein